MDNIKEKFRSHITEEYSNKKRFDYTSLLTTEKVSNSKLSIYIKSIASDKELYSRKAIELLTNEPDDYSGYSMSMFRAYEVTSSRTKLNARLISYDTYIDLHMNKLELLLHTLDDVLDRVEGYRGIVTISINHRETVNILNALLSFDFWENMELSEFSNRVSFYSEELLKKVVKKLSSMPNVIVTLKDKDLATAVGNYKQFTNDVLKSMDDIEYMLESPELYDEMFLDPSIYPSQSYLCSIIKGYRLDGISEKNYFPPRFKDIFYNDSDFKFNIDLLENRKKVIKTLGIIRELNKAKYLGCEDSTSYLAIDNVQKITTDDGTEKLCAELCEVPKINISLRKLHNIGVEIEDYIDPYFWDTYPNNCFIGLEWYPGSIPQECLMLSCADKQPRSSIQLNAIHLFAMHDYDEKSQMGYTLYVIKTASQFIYNIYRFQSPNGINANNKHNTFIKKLLDNLLIACKEQVNIYVVGDIAEKTYMYNTNHNVEVVPLSYNELNFSEKYLFDEMYDAVSNKTMFGCLYITYGSSSFTDISDKEHFTIRRERYEYR